MKKPTPRRSSEPARRKRQARDYGGSTERPGRTPVAALFDFLSVLRCGSINKAAEELQISQPSLTRRIKKLEDWLAVRLLDRTSSGIMPTSFGRALLPHLQEMEMRLSQALLEIQRLQGLKSSRICFGVTATVVDKIVPPAVRHFTTWWPDVSIDFCVNTKTDLINIVRAGEVDFAIVPMAAGDGDPDWIREELFADRMHMIVGPHHPLAGRNDLPHAAVADYPWILLSRSPAMHSVFQRLFQDDDLDLPADAFETGIQDVIKKLLTSTDRIALLPSFTVADELRRGELTIIDTGRPPVLVTYNIVSRRAHPLSPAAKKLAFCLRASAKALKFKKQAEYASAV